MNNYLQILNCICKVIIKSVCDTRSQGIRDQLLILFIHNIPGWELEQLPCQQLELEPGQHGSDNDMLPDGTKPLPEPMFTIISGWVNAREM